MRRPNPPLPPVTTATAFFKSMKVPPRKQRYRGAAARASPLEQCELLRALARRREVLGRELELAAVETEPLARRLETAADHPGDRPGAGHPLAPLRVVIFAAAHVADQLEDVAFAVGEIFAQPLAEQIAQLQWQPQQNVTGFLHTNGSSGIEDALDLHVVDRRNDRRDHHRGRNAGFR